MRSASPGPGPSTLQRRQEAIQRQIWRWSREEDRLDRWSGYVGEEAEGVRGFTLEVVDDLKLADARDKGGFVPVYEEGLGRSVLAVDTGQTGRSAQALAELPENPPRPNRAKRQAVSLSSSGTNLNTSSTPTISPSSVASSTSSYSTGNGLYGTSLTATDNSGNGNATPTPASTNTPSTTVNAQTFTPSWISTGLTPNPTGSSTALTGTETVTSGTGTGVSTRTSATSTSTKTTAAPQYVPTAGVALVDGANGLVLNMTLNGDSTGEAVYAVPIVIGHRQGSRRRRKILSDEVDGADIAGDVDRRAPADEYQALMMQVDLGSSDMWVAASTCTTSVCQGKGVTLYNAGYALDAGASANLTYQTGYASGEIYWDEVQMGVTVDQITTAINGTGNGGTSGFDISAQAFIAANQVANEDLTGGVFSGLLGLALPANSIISEIIPGIYGSSPDGATFLDNLFSSGVSAPNARYFTLSLERSGDTRTRSSLGIGKHDDFVCPKPCTPSFNSLVSSSVGPLYWRILLQGISWTNYTNPTSATSGWLDPSTMSIAMTSSSSNVLGTTVPVAVLDSGGSQVLFADRPLLDSIYGNWGVSMSSDGYYYVPCSTPMMLSFQFNGVQYPVHPLDMSDYYTGTTTCIGSLQYASGLTAGDIILGSSFLKNAYSVFSYPSADSSSSSWSPQVGLVPLTIPSSSAQEFYNVRALQEPIASATAATNPTAVASQAAAAAAGNHVVSVGVIAAVAVVGFIVIAAGLFCAWFFYMKRKRSRNTKEGEPVGANYMDDKTDGDSGTQRQSKKSSMFMARQKSMIDGYSDFETLSSWPNSESKTDMAYDEPEDMHLMEELSGASGAAGVTGTPESGQHRRRPSNWESSYPPIGWTNLKDRDRAQSPSRSPGRALTYNASTPGPSDSAVDMDTSQALISPTRQPLIRLVSSRQDRVRDTGRPREQSVGSTFEMEQMGYAKQLARHAREGSSGSGSFIPMASPGHGQ